MPILSFEKVYFVGHGGIHMPSEELCGFEVKLVYKVSSLSAKAIQ